MHKNVKINKNMGICSSSHFNTRNITHSTPICVSHPSSLPNALWLTFHFRSILPRLFFSQHFTLRHLPCRFSLSNLYNMWTRQQWVHDPTEMNKSSNYERLNVGCAMSHSDHTGSLLRVRMNASHGPQWLRFDTDNVASIAVCFTLRNQCRISSSWFSNVPSFWWETRQDSTTEMILWSMILIYIVPSTPLHSLLNLVLRLYHYSWAPCTHWSTFVSVRSFRLLSTQLTHLSTKFIAVSRYCIL